MTTTELREQFILRLADDLTVAVYGHDPMDTEATDVFHAIAAELTREHLAQAESTADR